MIRKIYHWLYEGDIPAQERIFRLILIVGNVVNVLAIISGLFLDNFRSTLVLLVLLLASFLAASVATFKYRRFKAASSLIALVLICGLFPAMFFASGGIEGGATVWFVLGILYVFMMFRNRREMAAFLIVALLSDVATYYVGYYRSEWITLLTKEDMYMDSFFAVLLVGTALGIAMMFQIDVFERERQLTEKQKKEIEQISRSKEAFFTNMSHEIRTPINTIIGLNEMILREEISDEVLEDAVNIQNASKMLLALVNDLLDFSKIQNQSMELVPSDYSTRELFQEITDLLRMRIEEKDLKFFVEVDENLPRVLHGDDRRIKQIAVNLLTNAAKYTKKGSVTMKVESELLDAETMRMTIAVTDTGIGIRKEELDTLYDSFHRADMEKNRAVEGTGLGLSITKQLVNLMDGRITVDSIYTKGSTFTVIIEQKIVDAAPIGEVDFIVRVKREGRAAYQQSFEAPEARVLIVDDNEANLMVAAKLLRDTKVQIDTAASGEECLEYTKNKRYHVILLDSMMQGLDGTQTLKELRRQENGLCRKAPVVALTANAGTFDEQRYMDEGFDGYLAKPVDGAHMEAEILKFLPDEIVEFRLDDSDRSELNESVRKILNRKRKKILISADSACDLPMELVEEYEIRLMYLYVETERGNFRDMVEVNSDNLSRYISSSTSQIRSVCASVEEYETFFAEALTEAEEVIHISLAGNAGQSFRQASSAAMGFGHVRVIDAGHISGGEGFLVLHAAKLVQEGYGVEDICEKLEMMKTQVDESYLLPSINIYAATGYANAFLTRLCAAMNLHPMVRFLQSTAHVTGLYTGRIDNARRRFIHRRLKNPGRINKELAIVTHVGCSVREQQMILQEMRKWVDFERVILQKASVSTSCNAGTGTIGIAFLRTKENN